MAGELFRSSDSMDWAAVVIISGRAEGGDKSIFLRRARKSLSLFASSTASHTASLAPGCFCRARLYKADIVRRAFFHSATDGERPESEEIMASEKNC